MSAFFPVLSVPKKTLARLEWFVWKATQTAATGWNLAMVLWRCSRNQALCEIGQRLLLGFNGFSGLSAVSPQDHRRQAPEPLTPAQHCQVSSTHSDSFRSHWNRQAPTLRRLAPSPRPPRPLPEPSPRRELLNGRWWQGREIMDGFITAALTWWLLAPLGTDHIWRPFRLRLSGDRDDSERWWTLAPDLKEPRERRRQ